MNGISDDDKPNKFLSTEKQEQAKNNARARINIYSWDTWDDFIDYVSENVYTVRHRDTNNEGHLELIDRTNYGVEVDKELVDRYRTWRKKELDQDVVNEPEDLITFDDFLDIADPEVS